MYTSPIPMDRKSWRFEPRNFIFHRQVSLLRSFTDISENPLDWTPGVHGNLDLKWWTMIRSRVGKRLVGFWSYRVRVGCGFKMFEKESWFCDLLRIDFVYVSCYEHLWAIYFVGVNICVVEGPLGFFRWIWCYCWASKDCRCFRRLFVWFKMVPRLKAI